MIKLRELGAKFLKIIEENGRTILREVDTLAEAEGVEFLCPLCFKNNNGPIGTHSIICWFTNKVDDAVTPRPGRWNPSGTSLDDLTFVPPGAISVLLPDPDGCKYHGFIRNGEATLS